MNPVFIFLVVLASILLWFLLNGLFPIIGKIAYGLFKETKERMNESSDSSDKI